MDDYTALALDRIRAAELRADVRRWSLTRTARRRPCHRTTRVIGTAGSPAPACAACTG